MPEDKTKTAKAKEERFILMVKGEAVAARTRTMREQLKRLEAKDLMEKVRLVIIERVLDDKPLSGYQLVIADALMNYWFPSPDLRRVRHRENLAWWYEVGIKILMKEKGLSRTKAKEELALLDAKSFEALDRFLKRVKKEQREGGQKP